MTLDAAHPFAGPSPLPFHLPDFAAIRPEHYREAFDAGMAEGLAELDALAADPAPPTAENVLDAWERSGKVLDRAVEAFYVVKWAESSDALDALEAEYAPKLAAHSDAIFMNADLYDRLRALDARAKAGELRGLTGVDAPYEPPENPDLVVDTTGADIDKLVAQVLGALNALR